MRTEDRSQRLFIREYLSMIDMSARQCVKNGPGNYGSLESFVLRHGCEMTKRIPLPRGVHLGAKKACFQNSTLLATSHSAGQKAGTFTYCEGYAIGCFMPVLHAWCINLRAEVLELTWDDSIGKDFQYFGIAFRRDYLLRRIRSQGDYGLIGAEGTAKNPYPMLTAHSKEWRHPIMDQVFGQRNKSSQP